MSRLAVLFEAVIGTFSRQFHEDDKSIVIKEVARAVVSAVSVLCMRDA